MNPEILSVGFINWDIILQTPTLPEEDHSSKLTNETKKPGGSSTNTAIALEKLGVNSALAGSIGDDSTATKLKTALESNNITTYLKENQKTTKIYSIVTEDNDPRYLYAEDSIGKFTTDIIPDSKWTTLDHIHLTSFDKTISNKFVQKAKQHNLSISFNPCHKFSTVKFPYIISNSDVVIVNDTEYETLSQRYNIDKLQENTYIIITHGSDGSTARYKRTESTHSGFSTTVADTVGAGDSFSAGFLTQWISNKDLYTCLKYGNAVAALSVRKHGSPTEIQPENLTEYL